MARVKGGYVTRQRRKKVLKQAKGYFGNKSTHFKKAKEQLLKSLTYAYRDRKNRKREYRRFWIQRINAATRQYGMSYSVFMNGLKKLDIQLNRKMLSELAIHEPTVFKGLVDQVKANQK